MKTAVAEGPYWSAFRERLSGGLELPLFFAWAVCAFILLLMLVVVWVSFLPGLPTQPGFTLNNYRDALADRFLPTMWNTIVVGTGTVALSLFFAVPMAWLIHRSDIPLKPWLLAAIIVSVLIPGFMKAMGWILLLSPKIGLINLSFMELFGLQNPPFSIYNLPGIIFVQGLMLTPTVFFLIAGPMRSVDPALEESSEVSGLNKWQTLLRVTLPLMFPAILAAAIYAFMTAVSIYEVPVLLVGFGKYPLLSTALFLSTGGMWDVTRLPRFGVAAVYGLFISIPSILSLIYYFRLIKQGHSYAVVTGRGYRPKLFPLGPWKYPALSFVLGYIMLGIILPFCVLLWTSLLPSLKMPSIAALSHLTLKFYTASWEVMGDDVIYNTVLLMLITPAAILFLSLMVSWIVVRTRTWGRGAMDKIIMLPHAIPGIAFAFALTIVAMMMARWFPIFPLYGTIWIIILANVVNRLAYATRVTNAALLQVSKDLEDAGAVCGMGKLRVVLSVMVPLIAPSLIYAGVWTTMLVFRELSMALMLSKPGNTVLSVRVFLRWQSGQMSEAAAMGVIMVMVLAIIFLFAQRLFREKLYGFENP